MPQIKILVSGSGMPGVTSVARTLTSGKHAPADYSSVTIDYERTERVVDGKKIVVFDLGCQSAFLDRFTGELAEFIFTGTSTLIYVVDVLEIGSIPKAKYYLDRERECLYKYSPSGKLFIFLNKIDLIPTKMFAEVIETIIDYLSRNKVDLPPLHPSIFYPVSCISGTTIFEAGDDFYTDLISRHFPGMWLDTFKWDFWKSIDRSNS